MKRILVLCVLCVLLGVVGGAAASESPPDLDRADWLGEGRLVEAYALADGGSLIIADTGNPNYFIVALTDGEGAQAARRVALEGRGMPDILFTEICGAWLHVFYSWMDGDDIYHYKFELPHVERSYLPFVCRSD